MLDALFERLQQTNRLLQAHYSFHQNVPYTHSFNDEALEAKLAEWTERGLIRLQERTPRQCRSPSGWHLTAQGGALWEAERQPPWEGFCRTTVRFYRRRDEPAETAVFRVYAFSEGPIRDVISDMERNPNDWWQLADPPSQLLIEPSGETLVYWKSLPVLEGRIRVHAERSYDAALPGVERPQTFWRNTNELTRYRSAVRS